MHIVLLTDFSLTRVFLTRPMINLCRELELEIVAQVRGRGKSAEAGDRQVINCEYMR